MENRKQQSVYKNIYEIEVKGILDEQWSEWFDGFSVTYLDNKNTLFRGHIQDQSALHGTLAKIRDLGLTLVRLAEAEKTLTSEDVLIKKDDSSVKMEARERYKENKE